jgi:hypothetical protein
MVIKVFINKEYIVTPDFTVFLKRCVFVFKYQESEGKFRPAALKCFFFIKQ